MGLMEILRLRQREVGHFEPSTAKYPLPPEVKERLFRMGYSFFVDIRPESLEQLLTERKEDIHYVNSLQALRKIAPPAVEVAVNPNLRRIDIQVLNRKFEESGMTTIEAKKFHASAWVQVELAYEQQFGKSFSRGKFIRTIDPAAYPFDIVKDTIYHSPGRVKVSDPSEWFLGSQPDKFKDFPAQVFETERIAYNRESELNELLGGGEKFTRPDLIIEVPFVALVGRHPVNHKLVVFGWGPGPDYNHSRILDLPVVVSRLD